MGGVMLSPNIKKTSQRIDPAGNIIDPKTKEVLVPIEQEYVPPYTPPSEQKKPEPLKEIPTSDPVRQVSLAEEIKEAETHLANLKLRKAEEIIKKKKELEELEKL